MTAYEFPVQQAPPAAHVCVVYDPTDGRVVHIHEFIGVGFDPGDCARMALDTVRSLLEPAKSLGVIQSDRLKVLHAPGLTLRPGAEFRVDITSNELVSSEPRHLLVDAFERSRARRMRQKT
jgi:hypothetical protein